MRPGDTTFAPVFLSVAVLSACSSLKPSKKSSSPASESADLQVEVADAPQMLGKITLTEAGSVTYEPALQITFPETIKPLCLAGVSAYLPTIVNDGLIGIRWFNPIALAANKESKNQDKADGWALQAFANVTGTTLPDFSKLQEGSVIVQRPDFEGTAAPNGLVNNFALRAQAGFGMPIGRTVFFSLRARATSRLLIDDAELIRTTPVVNNANPVAVTGSLALKAGFHNVVVEFVNGPGAALFEARMSFDNNMNFEPLIANGALPFHILVDSAPAQSSSAIDAQNNLASKSSHWPVIGGSQTVLNCGQGLSDAVGDSVGQGGFLNANGAVLLVEQKAWEITTAFPSAQIQSFWVGSSPSQQAVNAVAVTNEDIGFTLYNGQMLKISKSQFDPRPAKEKSLRVLGIAGTLVEGRFYQKVLLSYETDSGLMVATLAIDLAGGKMGANIRELDKQIGSPLSPIGNSDGLALFQAGGKIFALSIDGTRMAELEIPQEVDGARLFGDAVIVSGAGKMAKFATTSMRERFLALANNAQDLEAQHLPMGRLELQAFPDNAPGMIFADQFDQMWRLSGGQLLAEVPASRSLLVLNPNDGILYIKNPEKVATVKLSDDGKEVLVQDSAGTIYMRSDAVAASTADQLLLDIQFTSGNALKTQISRRVILGQFDAPIQGGTKKDNGGVVVTNPGGGTTPVVSYAQSVAPLMTRSCLGAGCHSSPNAAAGAPLDTKNDVRVRIDNVVGASGPNGNMPLGGRPRLTAAELQMLANWQASGFGD